MHEIISYFELCFFVSLENQVVEKFWSWELQQLWEGMYFLILYELAWLFVSYSSFQLWYWDVIDHKFYYCICNYHFVFVIIKLFWQKKFWFGVNNKFANDFFFQFLISDFFMVVKAEVKNKVTFKSKYEFHSCQIEVKDVLWTGFGFSGFPKISGFSEKRTFEIFIAEICVQGCKKVR